MFAARRATQFTPQFEAGVRSVVAAARANDNGESEVKKSWPGWGTEGGSLARIFLVGKRGDGHQTRK
jgi:hypothetical protein